jgi:chaperonin GroES
MKEVESMATTVKSKIQPLGDRVLVKVLEAEEKTKGGIVLPDTAKEKPQQAEVVAVGKGKVQDGKNIPLEVKVGDKILFGRYSGTELSVEGEEYLMLKEDDIVAIVK